MHANTPPQVGLPGLQQHLYRGVGQAALNGERFQEASFVHRQCWLQLRHLYRGVGQAALCCKRCHAAIPACCNPTLPSRPVSLAFTPWRRCAAGGPGRLLRPGAPKPPPPPPPRAQATLAFYALALHSGPLPPERNIIPVDADDFLQALRCAVVYEM